VPDLIYDPIETDTDVLEQDAIDYLKSRWPSWTPSDPSLVSWLLGAFSQMVGEARDVASDVPPSIFFYFGDKIIGLPPVDATNAVVQSTWAFSTNPAGRTVVAGTTVSIDDAEGNPIAFEVVADVVVNSPTLTTPAGGVTLRAVEAGTDANGLGGNGVLAEPIDPIAWVTTVTLTGATSGGNDIEDTDDYLSRLSDRLTLLTPRPILPKDFELLAIDVAKQNGVDIRALGLDGYDPGTLTYNNERTMTVAVIMRDTGVNVSAPIKTAIQTELDSEREVNFVVNVIDPTQTNFDVTFTIKVMPNYDSAQTIADAIANVQSYLSPITSGLPPGQEGSGWIKQDALRRQEISTVINNTQGVDHWETLTIGLAGGGQTTAETFVLSGAAPTFGAGTVLGTVV
jgi:hypothetical protein